MRAWLVALAVVLFAGEAGAEPVRLLLAVGARHGAADEAGLRYSTDDARRVRDVFVALGGVRPENAVLLPDPTLGQLRTVMDRLTERARGFPKNELTFVFYFSGHGDSRALHLAGEVMPMPELSARIAGISAGLRIVITDACRTLRMKGATAERAFDVRLGAKQTAAGTAWIHAAADGEAAQESDALGGAVFTHYLVSGLRGAADRDADRRVTLAEVYAFAYHLTLFGRREARESCRDRLRRSSSRSAHPSCSRRPRAARHGCGCRPAPISSIWFTPSARARWWRKLGAIAAERASSRSRRAGI
jgi:hypothetical protein